MINAGCEGKFHFANTPKVDEMGFPMHWFKVVCPRLRNLENVFFQTNLEINTLNYSFVINKMFKL